MPPYDYNGYFDLDNYNRVQRDLLRKHFRESFYTAVSDLPLPENKTKVGLHGIMADVPADKPKRRFRDDG